MFKRSVRGAVRRGVVTEKGVSMLTDDAFMQLLIEQDRNPIAIALRDRRLYKRALDLPASEVPDAQPWVSEDTDLLEKVEDYLAEEVGLGEGELLLDFPTRDNMLAVELPLRLRDGSVDRLTSEGRAGHLGLPRIADELYRSAQRLRVFVAKPIRKKLAHVVELVAQPAADVRKQVG